MSKTNSQDIQVKQAEAFLASHLGEEPTDVVLVGEGAWSRCFGFRYGDQDLVIRFGNHVDDFEKDQLAYQYHSAALLIPQVFEIGQVFGGYYAISARAYGVSLESLNAAQWQATIPSLVAMLEALRTANLSATNGLGGWDVTGSAPMRNWSEHLLAVGNDTPDRRTYGWRKQLATWPEGEATFVWGFDLLKQVVSDAVPRCLLHCDLINRNVLVHENKISGVFDWGCSLYGDHLYELAWFEFWAPWYPELDMVALRAALEQRWREVGYNPADQATRLMACYLHIGLDHLAYNAYTGNAVNLLGTAARMRALAPRG